MRFKDAFRAQYYLASLEKEVACTINGLTHCSFFEVDVSCILDDFCSELSEELDQILLPTIVHEIHEAKNNGHLKGNTPLAKYISFFVDQEGGAYTFFASDIVKNYPFLFEMVDEIIRQSFLNLKKCLNRFNQHSNEIKQFFQITEYSIKKIKILSSSDRHRGQQALLLQLSNNEKII